MGKTPKKQNTASDSVSEVASDSVSEVASEQKFHFQENSQFNLNTDYSSPPPTSIYTAHTKQQKSKNTKIAMVALLSICLLSGSFIGCAVTYTTFNNKLNDLQTQINYLNGQSSISGGQGTNSVSLANLYNNVKSSVVEVTCSVPQYNWFGNVMGYTSQQGSGFVTTVNNQQVIVTNYHVIESATSISVTFADGSKRDATISGTKPNMDIAVLKISSIPKNTNSLTLVSSSNLNVGDNVVAIGSPYGLSGTLTAGIISALGRTIEGVNNNREVTISDVIQTTTQINSGNSGGPLLNMQGQVIGITTAIVSGSQGLGFAISSDTILKEIGSLVK
ncbi:MAG: trypsin-like peptidase domain-containing protein [Nitrososphaerota archaeon]|jgi:S1-C subfamily serine protease|nr:trypsin-like peptidase domain-containing protein [Nitrososphaerota archaeon]